MSAQPLGQGDILRARHAVAEREREDLVARIEAREAEIYADPALNREYALRCVDSDRWVCVKDINGEWVQVKPSKVWESWVEWTAEQEVRP